MPAVVGVAATLIRRKQECKIVYADAESVGDAVAELTPSLSSSLLDASVPRTECEKEWWEATADLAVAATGAAVEGATVTTRESMLDVADSVSARALPPRSVSLASL